MSLTKYNSHLPDLLNGIFGRDMDEIFNANWPVSNWASTMRLGTSMPAVNIKEDDDNFHLDIAAPGLKKEDFQVTLDNDLLTVSVQQSHENEEKDDKGRFMKREYSYQDFSRSFRLPDCCKDNVEARYVDGILHLTIPKKEEAKRKAPRQIAIS